VALFLIDPQEKLDWSHDWSSFIAEGDTIASRLWTITPLHGTSPESPTLLETPTGSVYVSNCRVGYVYQLSERITTGAGVTAEKSIALRCEQT
jgi:hypothetical protein